MFSIRRGREEMFVLAAPEQSISDRSSETSEQHVGAVRKTEKSFNQDAARLFFSPFCLR
jgi:hypothetical protein